MSLLSDKVLTSLQEALPYYKIWSEYYVQYKGNKLYIDFYIPELLVAVEVQGIQHDKFTPFYHEDEYAYKASKFRDALKREWARESSPKIRLVEVREKDLPLSKADVMALISGETT